MSGGQGLSRRLWLVKWWLLAMPHFLVLGVIGVGLRGLSALLTLFAGVSLLFTGAPRTPHAPPGGRGDRR
ncbi:hypothetical protein [Streptomyces sp. NPDC046909]|uniref:hypothetical protein n=1 Tax=Streptomyces sp. NPDC046909 TaxID=3155617 RepID=UPI00340BB9DA